jgi:hypothetical protein
MPVPHTGSHPCATRQNFEQTVGYGVLKKTLLLQPGWRELRAIRSRAVRCFSSALMATRDRKALFQIAATRRQFLIQAVRDVVCMHDAQHGFSAFRRLSVSTSLLLPAPFRSSSTPLLTQHATGTRQPSVA